MLCRGLLELDPARGGGSRCSHHFIWLDEEAADGLLSLDVVEDDQGVLEAQRDALRLPYTVTAHHVRRRSGSRQHVLGG